MKAKIILGGPGETNIKIGDIDLVKLLPINNLQITVGPGELPMLKMNTYLTKAEIEMNGLLKIMGKDFIVTVEERK